MRRTAACWLLLCILAWLGCGKTPEPPRAQQGVIDLRDWDFGRDGMVRLDGDWLWYWQKLLPPSALRDDAAPPPAPTGTYSFPHIWNGMVVDGQTLSASGYATFRLRVLLPQAGSYGVKLKLVNAASALWLDERKLTESGRLSESPVGYQQHGLTQAAYFDTTRSQIDLTVHYANFGFFRGGPRSGIWFGTSTQIQQQREQALLREGALAAACFTIGVFQILLYLLRRAESAPLGLGMFCIGLATWLAMQGELLLTQLFPHVPYDWMRKLEYLALAVMTPAFVHFFFHLYPGQLDKWVRRAANLVFTTFGFVVLLTPAPIYTRALIAMQLFTLLMVLYGIYVTVRVVRRGLSDARLFAFGFVSLALGVSYDILRITLQPLAIVPITPLAVLLLIFADALILARKSARAYATIESQAQALERLSRAYYRFVPQAFLHLLGKRDITTVELGDQIQRTMTVLFADVRGFTSLSEQMSPEENFTFINRLLRHLGPLIRDHKGFIDKYLGDGIMALFPEHPGDALRAACAMRQTLRRFNASRVSAGQPPIRIGVGIHTGTLMLGTVGEPERMDGTVIADAVNTAARLESLTKRYGVTILASAESIEKSGFAEKYPLHIRLIGKVRAKGKTAAVELYEVFDEEAVAASDSRSSFPPSSGSLPSGTSFPGSDSPYDSADTLRLKQESRSEFAGGLRLFQEGRFEEAMKIFAEIAGLNPDDRPAAYYAARCAFFVQHGAPADWDGIEALTEK